MKPRRLSKLERFYEVGECYQTLERMVFSDKEAYIKNMNHPNAWQELKNYSLPKGTIITFLELINHPNAILAIFLYDNKILVGPPGTVESQKAAKMRFRKIT